MSFGKRPSFLFYFPICHRFGSTKNLALFRSGSKHQKYNNKSKNAHASKVIEEADVCRTKEAMSPISIVSFYLGRRRWRRVFFCITSAATASSSCWWWTPNHRNIDATRPMNVTYGRRRCRPPRQLFDMSGDRNFKTQAYFEMMNKYCHQNCGSKTPRRN